MSPINALPAGTIFFNSIYIDLLLAVLGLCIGNMINIAVEYAVAGRSLLSFELVCAHCGRGLSLIDQVPLLSFILLKGRYQNCKHAVSWQNPAIEAATSIMLVAFSYKWEGWSLVGMFVLGCTLIAVTATDIRARIIPHDITYPSMLLGLLFSWIVRGDLQGALIGVAMSYLALDMLAHYGQKIYLAGRPDLVYRAGEDSENDREHDTGEIQFLGGADSVLAAVIAAWLGWKKLLVVLAVSLVAGICLAVYTGLRRAYLQGYLTRVLRLCLLGSFLGFLTIGIPVSVMLGFVSGGVNYGLLVGAMGGMLGLMYGVIASAPRRIVTVPFGPALALGGIIAMFN